MLRTVNASGDRPMKFPLEGRQQLHVASLIRGNQEVIDVIPIDHCNIN